MECNICLQPFDTTELRPKVLRCGHTYCVKCLQLLPIKKCPVDMKVFDEEAAELPDNFIVLQNLQVPLPQRFWCTSCEKEATAVCVDDHLVRNLSKARTQEAARHLQALQRAEAVLDAALDPVRDAMESSLETVTQGFKEALQREKQRLTATQGRLEAALGADTATWEQAKKDAELGGLPLAVWRLTAALADPTAACEVTLRRGAAGDAAWRCEVRPADDAAFRLLLCVLAASGQLQHQAQDQAEQGAVPEAPVWIERSNCDLSLGQQTSHLGCRVKTSDGLGTVTEIVCERSVTFAKVKIDRTAQLLDCSCSKLNPVLEPWGLICEATASAFDALATSSSEKIKVKADLLASDGLKEVVTLTGLQCSTSTSFCQQVLQQVAPRLERLQLVSPQQQHVDQALAMPRLHSLAVVDVKKEWLQKVAAKESLRFLELHGRFEDSLGEPLPVFSRPVPPAGLRWLRCGFYPLRAALALARAHAATLEELQLVADARWDGSPYGCPNLALEVQQCGLARLKRLVLLRQNAYGSLCQHFMCESQKLKIWDLFVGCGVSIEVLCSLCDQSCMPQATSPAP